MANLQFCTKAGTLNQLQNIVTQAKIAPLVFFKVSDWLNDEESCLKLIKSMSAQNKWIVRSSCTQEDMENESNAGAFLSIPNISSDSLQEAINQVIQSYGAAASMQDEVLVQPMLQNVCRSGVALSHDPNTCSPYRTINWANGSNTFLVTGGTEETQCWQHAALSHSTAPSEITPVIVLLEELISIFGHVPIDCEFAFTKEENRETLWLLQVRHLILTNKPQPDQQQAQILSLIEKQVSRGMSQHPFLMGKRTVYGVMPDWNPAEIIGIRPRPLALSLYRELITDSIWAYQRHNYGYRNLRSFPLMPDFFGLPYIDMRVSFNSFIPSELEERIANRLVDYYIERILQEPALHDKVEFEIVFSCYTFDLADRLSKLSSVGFTQEDQAKLSLSLRKLTNKIMHPQHGLWQQDAKKLEVLKNRRESILNSKMDNLEKIYWLIEDGKRYGTLPFAGLARFGFIAIQMLTSLVSIGVITEDDYDAFLRSISTVSDELTKDKDNLDKDTFLSKYGHLRPGTYDILSTRYDELPEQYFDWVNPSITNTKQVNDKSFKFSPKQIHEIDKLLITHGLELDANSFIEFLKSGIQLRELAKFHFTKNLSDALSLIIEFGNVLGITREQLAFANINIFKELHVSAANQKQSLINIINLGKESYLEALYLNLPPVIVTPKDIWSFGWPESSPNFITQKQVLADVSTTFDRRDIEGKIICIPNADPGFDWLFSHSIAGLITTWGGCNSHMAIRAAEKGLPSIIGVGVKKYNQWSKAKKLHIDCSNRRVEIIQ